MHVSDPQFSHMDKICYVVSIIGLKKFLQLFDEILQVQDPNYHSCVNFPIENTWHGISNFADAANAMTFDPESHVRTHHVQSQKLSTIHSYS